MKTVRPFVIVSSVSTCASATFTSNTVISAGDMTYEGQDLVVNGCTLSAAGPHAFNSLTLINSATLTHPACTESATYTLELTIAGAVYVAANSAIDATARRFVRGYTQGNSTNGAATGQSASSYGGMGISLAGEAHRVYSDYRTPNEHGSGGGIRIDTAILAGTGVLRANGGDTTGTWGGGGRIALYYSVGDFNVLNNVSARGGARASCRHIF